MEEGYGDEREPSSLISRRMINGSIIDATQWATPDVGALTDEDRAQYFARRHAVLLYMAGASFQRIKELTSLGGKQAYRLIRERCVEIHPDGRPYGWRGLLRYLRIKPYKRKSTVRVDSFGYGAAGALQLVLDTHPELHKAFDAYIVSTSAPWGVPLPLGAHRNWVESDVDPSA